MNAAIKVQDDFLIADMSLAAWGRKEIAIAASWPSAKSTPRRNR
jgi:S-adenosylhomocysteine hydrolase